MSVELKIKSKHLGEEARIIRAEERKLKQHAKYLKNKFGDELRVYDANVSWYYRQKTPLGVVTEKLNTIYYHRIWDVRNENRATFLARAYLAGRTYSSVERSVKDRALLQYTILPRTLKMVQKYGGKSYKDLKIEQLIQWTEQ